MAIIAIEESAWDMTESKDEDAMRWAMADLALGTPARFDDSTDTWYVWSHRFTLDQVAYWGCLWENIGKIGAEWTPPKDGDGAIDRAACEAEIYALIENDIVWPANITYTHLVDVEVPVMVHAEFPILDEEGNSTGETYWRWVDSGETQIIQVEQSLPNPWQITLDAQGVSKAFAGDWRVPDGWTPVGVV